MAVTRDHLYEQVWAKPMLAVAKDDEVSAKYLARVCAALNVPWPPTGLLGDGRGVTHAGVRRPAGENLAPAERPHPVPMPRSQRGRLGTSLRV